MQIKSFIAATVLLASKSPMSRCPVTTNQLFLLTSLFCFLFFFSSSRDPRTD
jgi:hypothetical protein